MDFQIIWSPRGVETLAELVDYIARDNPTAARQMGEMLFQKIQLLRQHPYMGRVFPKLKRADVREVIVRPHRVIYRLAEAKHTITILTIWHGARQEPDIK